MAFNIVISDEAQADFESHYLYYREIANKKIADNFAKSFIEAKELIAYNPFFQIWFDEFRVLPLKTYPYIVFFHLEIESKTIVISRIFHTSQKPGRYPQKK